MSDEAIETRSERMIGDSYLATPTDLDRLRKLADSTPGISKSEHVRRAVASYLNEVCPEVEKEI